MAEAAEMKSNRVRPIDPGNRAEVELVAARMRQTLVEVLGEQRGVAMYSMDWLVERVLWHLDPGKSTAQVLLSEDAAGHVTGHTIVRLETDDDGKRIGLFSTTFVEPASRKLAIASALLSRGEGWMLSHAMTTAVTYTSETNTRLINLFRKHGYEIVLARSEMVRLERLIGGAPP
jgi:GNAT superfamily N-acetyltransferase